MKRHFLHPLSANKNYTNTDLLQSKIKASGLKKKFIAEELGITVKALNKKIKNKVEFLASEINKLCILLNLSDPEITEIFFNE